MVSTINPSSPAPAQAPGLASKLGRPGWGWRALTYTVAIVVVAPVAALLWLAAQGSLDHWLHLGNFVLPVAMRNTAVLLLGVGILVGCLGTGAAWLITAFRFPTRNILAWALLLPLAVPTYIVAFAYLDLLHPIGPVQGFIRDLLGYSSPRQFRLPDIRSLWGAVVLLGFVLYPYVYLSTRVMFATQAASLLEAGRTLGLSARGVFWRVALPLARPAIAVGVSLALLEALNDIGAAEFLGVQTLTVAVYTTWITRSDMAGAAQIALLMLFIVIGLITLERHGRRYQRFSSTQRMHPIQPRPLRGVSALIAMGLGWFPIIVGFFAPAAYLVYETLRHFHGVGAVSAQLLDSGWNTLRLAFFATVVTVVLGLLVAWAARNVRKGTQTALLGLSRRLSTIGYAVPGTVLAIGLLLPLNLIDSAIFQIGNWFTGLSPRLFLMGSFTALVCAYVIRFLAISIGGFESGLARIPPSLEQASRLLGESAEGTLRRVHLPLLRPAIGATALLVFVDAMKELPATLLLRPVNFETLATWLYGEAARGTYDEGAIAALAIVAAGLLPVILLARHQLRASH